MIKSVEEYEIEKVCSFCKAYLLGVKINCQLKAYGLNRDFLKIWIVYEDSKVSSVISMFENSVTLVSDNASSCEEIKAFLDMLGFSQLCCSKKTADFLGYENTTERKAYIFSSENTEYFLPELSSEYYKDAYSLISRNIPDSFEESRDAYLSFLSDFTFRERRGFARAKGIVEDGRLVSCALTSAETEHDAIISGVSCDMNSRRKGLGKTTVLSLCNELKSENKTSYVIALNESAEGFYEHIGFDFKETISFIERK